MSYMIEGGGSPTLSKAKSWLYRYPENSHQLLKALTEVNHPHFYVIVLTLFRKLELILRKNFI